MVEALEAPKSQEREPNKTSYNTQVISSILKGSKLKLDGSNYTAWRAQINILLDLQGLEDVIKKPGDLKD
jgi:hypothetical protein